MSAIAQFTMMENNKRVRELSDGNLSGYAYLNLLVYLEDVYDFEVTGPPPCACEIDADYFVSFDYDERESFLRLIDICLDLEEMLGSMSTDFGMEPDIVKTALDTLTQNIKAVTPDTWLLVEIY